MEGSYSTKSRSNGYYIGRSSKNNSLFYSRISIECFFFPNIFCFFSMLECFPFYFTCLRRRYRLGFGAFFDSFSVFRCTVVSSFSVFFIGTAVTSEFPFSRISFLFLVSYSILDLVFFNGS
jgi:hypothetical protein